jgi:hypothetical protein
VHPLAELKRLVASRASRETGTVLSAAAGRASIATASGMREVSVGQIAVTAADRVLIERGVLIGRLSATSPAIYRV